MPDDLIHNCVDSGCAGEQCNRIKIACSWCSQPTFLECVLDRPEFLCLLKTIITNKSHREFSTSHWNIVQSAVDAIFERNTSIDFVCLECKSTGTHSSFVASSENALIDTKRQVAAANALITTLREEKTTAVDTLSQQISEANATINSLKIQIDASARNKCNNFNDKITSIKSLVSELALVNDSFTVAIKQLSSAFDDDSETFSSQQGNVSSNLSILSSTSTDFR